MSPALPEFHRQSGALMIEVLVTLAVVVVGLWAMLNLHIRSQLLETESSQRTRALLLLEDMASRLMANPVAADDYLTDPTAGIGAEPCGATDAAATPSERDRGQWCRRLRGEGVVDVRGDAVDRLLQGRGCIEALAGVEGPGFLLTVAWQGLTPVSAPPAGLRCGQGSYDLPLRSACARQADACRRVVSTIVRLPGAGGA